jgi:hypothetical protein
MTAYRTTTGLPSSHTDDLNELGFPSPSTSSWEMLQRALANYKRLNGDLYLIRLLVPVDDGSQ